MHVGVDGDDGAFVPRLDRVIDVHGPAAAAAPIDAVAVDRTGPGVVVAPDVGLALEGGRHRSQLHGDLAGIGPVATDLRQLGTGQALRQLGHVLEQVPHGLGVALNGDDLGDLHRG